MRLYRAVCGRGLRAASTVQTMHRISRHFLNYSLPWPAFLSALEHTYTSWWRTWLALVSPFSLDLFAEVQALLFVVSAIKLHSPVLVF